MWQKIVNYFKSYNLASAGKRSTILALAVILMPLGVAFYYQCGLGTDPYSVFVDGEHYLMNLTHGEVSTINNVVLFALMLIFGRKYINLGTVVNTFAFGPILDLFNLKAIPAIFPPDERTLFIQFVLLAAGLVIFAVSVALFIIADLGIGGVEFASIKLADITKIDIKWIRIAIDVFCTIVGIVLGLLASKGVFDLIGIGTIVGAFGTGLIMKWTINLLMGPCQKWFGPLRKTDQVEAPDEA